MITQTETDRLLEWAGWKNIRRNTDGLLWGTSPRNIHQVAPNLASLDVLHEMEMRLNYEEHTRFREWLWNIVEHESRTHTDRCFCSATAAQRLEALLLTLGFKDKP